MRVPAVNPQLSTTLVETACSPITCAKAADATKKIDDVEPDGAIAKSIRKKKKNKLDATRKTAYYTEQARRHVTCRFSIRFTEEEIQEEASNDLKSTI